MLLRYLKRVHAAVQGMREQLEEGGAVTLLAHSAGGWLARVYLLGWGTENIDRLVTLGSPHQPPPKVGPCPAVWATEALQRQDSIRKSGAALLQSSS